MNVLINPGLELLSGVVVNKLDGVLENWSEVDFGFQIAEFGFNVRMLP